jgi:hypothetical protein
MFMMQDRTTLHTSNSNGALLTDVDTKPANLFTQQWVSLPYYLHSPHPSSLLLKRQKYETKVQ